MKLLLAFTLAFSLSAARIQDTLYLSDGLTTAFGRIEIQGTHRNANGSSAITSRVTVPIATGGLVDFNLTGGAGVTFLATVYLTTPAGLVQSSYQEPIWSVPAGSGTYTIRGIRTASRSVTTYLPNGLYCLSVASRAWSIITCPDGTSGIPPWSATPATGGTRITDTLFLADGLTPVSGRILLQGYERDANGKTALTSPLAVPIGGGGTVNFLLEGGYGVHFQESIYPTASSGRSILEPPWVVPNTITTLTLRDIRGAGIPNTLARPDGLACINVGSGQWAYVTCPAGPNITWSTITSGIWAGITSSTWSTVIQ